MMSLVLSWVFFPLVLAAVAGGWGGLLQRLSAARLPGVLVLPLGLAGVIVASSIVTSWAAIAPAAAPVVVSGAVLGLALARPWEHLGRFRPAPAVAAVGLLLAYGAPVILSGAATFTGYIRLDDTATWLAFTDNVMAHGRSVASLPQSTYSLLLHTNLAGGYPLGAFMLLGVGHALTGIDSAWILQPYMALCGVGVGLCAYALLEQVVSSRRLRAVAAFIGGQPALLYGYSLWGGMKELTAAFLLALGAALVAALLTRRQAKARELLPLAGVAAALVDVLGAGAAAWIGPALVALVGAWLLPWGTARARLRAVASSVGALTAMAVVMALPLWVVIGSFIGNRGGLFKGLFSSGESAAVRLGNLIHPLRVWQLAGIWPVGDFRLSPPAAPTVVLIAVLLAAALAALAVLVRRRRYGVVVYVGLALIGCAISYFGGATPWVVGKVLAFSSPALLVCALAGVALLWGAGSRWRDGRRAASVVLLAVLAGGVLWSNVRQYHDVLLAPRARLAELQHIGGLVAHRGPTFINEYEIYADRHFLRAGAPVEPAEYRVPQLALNDGAVLTKTAFADLDSFPLPTLEAYPSLVVRRSPVESRPPSNYRLRWQGRYYQLWQRPAGSQTQVIEHVGLGDSSELPYCGEAQNMGSRSECSIAPAAIPACRFVTSLAAVARHDGARLVAYQRPPPIVLRGDQVLWPAAWIHDAAAHALTPTTPGTATAHIRVDGNQRYELWLGGSFARGLAVKVDGRAVGTVRNQLSNIGGYVSVASFYLTPGVHTFTFTYPHAGLRPGSGDNEFTTLAEIALQPLQTPRAAMLSVVPARARTLCGRPLDWIEVARG